MGHRYSIALPLAREPLAAPHYALCPAIADLPGARGAIDLVALRGWAMLPYGSRPDN